jgi:hypothetical protein
MGIENDAFPGIVVSLKKVLKGYSKSTLYAPGSAAVP